MQFYDAAAVRIDISCHPAFTTWLGLILNVFYMYYIYHAGIHERILQNYGNSTKIFKIYKALSLIEKGKIISLNLWVSQLCGKNLLCNSN